MKDKSWSLENAQKLVEEVPYTFSKPSKEAIEPLEKGHKAKLIFNLKSDDPKNPKCRAIVG